MIAITAAEEKVLELKREVAGGQERAVWNAVLSLPPKEFEFSDAEVAGMKAAIHTWDSYGVNADRRLACATTG